jgi:hypothetical protein
MTAILISSNIYIRYYNSAIQQSTTSDFTSHNTITMWPVTLNNTNTSNPPQNVNVYITNDLTLTAADQYFIMGSSNITFDGQNKKVTIDGVTQFFGGYPGLIQNGTSGTNGDGNNNIIIKNLGVETMNNSTLADYAGWIGQQYMNKNVGDCQVTNCYSTGDISGLGVGGIFGANSQGTFTNCYSSGLISGDGSGGIFGYDSSGTAINCYSSGDISGQEAGGIFGANSGGAAENCYSSGDIDGFGSGGIFGYSSNGTATNCYSSGDISGQEAGGIFGYYTSSGATATNCYSSGAITPNNNAGGIFGDYSSGIATNCYIANGIWNDADAVAANKLLNGPTYSTSFSQGSVWIDYDLSNTNKPWLLASFNSQIYNPNLITRNSTGTTDNGIITTGVDYKIIDVDNTSNSNFTSITNTGVISFANLSNNATYIVRVLRKNANSDPPIGYQINTLSLTIDTTAPAANLSSVKNGSNNLEVPTGTSTNATSLVLSGSKESGSSVIIYNGTAPFGTAPFTFNLSDFFSDGWNGATMQLKKNGTEVVATIGAGFIDGLNATETVSLEYGTTYELFWNTRGSYPEEVGISVVDPNGTTLYSMPYNSQALVGTTLTTIAPFSFSFTFNLSDFFSDGWNGATMQLKKNGTEVVATIGAGFIDGSNATETVSLEYGTTYELFWNTPGEYPEEVGISVVDPNGTTIYSMPYYSQTLFNTTLTTIITPPTITANTSTTWSYTISSLTNGTTYSFNVKETDAAGNTSAATNNWVVTIDRVSPTVISITRSKTTTLTFDPNNINNKDTITFTLSEVSPDFVVGSITVTGGTLDSLVGSGSVYTATFTALPDSTTSGTITVDANKFTDAAGNNNLGYTDTLTIPINTIPFTTFSLSPLSINEHELYSGSLSSDSTTDPQYTILSQPIDNLYISGNTVTAKYPFNYREYTNYPVQISGTASGITIIRSFNIQIVNLPDAPTLVYISNTKIPENSSIDSAVGLLRTSDPDAGDTFTYQFVSGAGSADNSSFTIENDILYTATTFNYNTKNTYSIRVKTTDSSGLSVENPIVLNVVIPTAGSFETSGLVGSSTTITLRGQNVTGGALVYEITKQPTYGLLTPSNINGVYTYVPNSNTVDSFEYVVKEDTMTSLPGRVIIYNYSESDIANIPRTLGTLEVDTFSFDGNKWRIGTIITDTFIQGPSFYRFGTITLTN